jgi:hypothetical protein
MIVGAITSLILISYSISRKHYNDYNIFLDNDFALLYPAMD